METENLHNILSQLAEKKLTEEDQQNLQKILEKYAVDKNPLAEEFHLESGFELPEDEWQPPEDFELDQEQVVEQTNPNNTETKEKINIQIDENGQYLLPLESSNQLELDLKEEQNVSEPLVQPVTTNIEPSKEVTIDNTKIDNTEPDISTDGRKEPILNFDEISNVQQNAIPLQEEKIVNPQKFSKFESMAQNAFGKVHNLLNFKDSNGKIDWYGKAHKTTLVLKGVKNIALNNKVMNKLKAYVGQKYSNSKFGIKATQISDTIVVNLMSREERYNKEFKNTMTLLLSLIHI